MSRIDERIAEALRHSGLEGDDSPEPTLLALALSAMGAQSRWLTGCMMFAGVVLMIVMVGSAARFFAVETLALKLMYSTSFLVCAMAIMGLKVWFWMVMNRNATVREVKRLQLTVALLAERLGADKGP